MEISNSLLQGRNCPFKEKNNHPASQNPQRVETADISTKTQLGSTRLVLFNDQ